MAKALEPSAEQVLEELEKPWGLRRLMFGKVGLCRPEVLEIKLARWRLTVSQQQCTTQVRVQRERIVEKPALLNIG